MENARIYDLPEQTPPILISAPIPISGFGPKSTALAARLGDSYRTVGPAAEAAESFRSQAGAGKLVADGMKACVAENEQEARETAHRLGPNEGLPSPLSSGLSCL